MTYLDHCAQIISTKGQNEVANETLDLLEYSNKFEAQQAIFHKEFLLPHFLHLVHHLTKRSA